MQIKVKKQLGKAILEIDIEERNDKEAIAKALVFTQPDYCSLCKGNNVIWIQNKANTEDGGSYVYIKRKCLNPKCLAESTLGEYKSGGYFWKPWEIYQPKGGSKRQIDKEMSNDIQDEIPPTDRNKEADDVKIEDIPF